ncbi:hypothetical protein KY290_001899 [Solanum tuberosum]|uniref:Subtilisin-like protease SBT1.9 n=1 Tax=Solanum tuberosum TaxID=4113 RepID=A0ABQ7WNI0_SOLTU|nr:hypothetical protein KY290_001899 [Solanum tuberosum]
MVMSSFPPLLLLSWFLFAHFFCLVVIAERSTYIVHLDKSLMPNMFASHHHWHSSTIESIKIVNPALLNSHHPVPKLLYSYDNVFHGFSAVLSKDELEVLKESTGFISAYKDRSVEAHTTHTSEYLKLNPSSGLWPASGFGQDVVIGVLDSGVWPESASFRDDGMPEIPKKWKGICRPGMEFNTSLCNKKLIGANYFNKGLLASNPDVNISMNSARDTKGHGTHVASIAAGNFVKGASYFGYAPGTAKGVAPRARLAVYKFSFDEGNVASDLIAAMDQAVADGVDMICISYGWRFIPLYEDTIAIAAFGAMAKGVLVSASAGNLGPGMGSLNNGVPWIFTVASGHTDRWFSGTLTLGNGLKIRGWSLFPARAIIDDWPVIYNKTVSACDSAELLAQVPDAGRSIIICRKSADAEEVASQMRSVAEARLGAAIFISNDPAVLRSIEFPNPGVVITPKEGKQPDILAPGVLILAAWPSNTMAATIGTNIELATDYLLESGTSMAAPHIAGIAALVKGAHPEWSPSAIRSALMTTANPLDNTQKPIRKSEDNKPATSLDMGAGHVDPNRALDPGLIYDTTPQDYVNLLCSLNFTEEQFKTIARSSANHNCSNPSSDINYPSFIAFFSLEGNFTFLEQKFRRTVTNVGSAAAKYRVKVKAPRNSKVSVSPQTLVFKKKNQKLSYSLTIRYKDDAEQEVQSGSITWVEENGNHTVRSPIVISPEIETW